MIFITSGAIAGAISGLVYYRLWIFYHEEAKQGDTYYVIRQFIRNNIGDLNAFLILFLPLFFIAFLLITKRYTKIFSSISGSILRIAEGDFNTHIPVKRNDEIGQIAKNVNRAADQLKQAVETGRYATSSKDRLIVDIAHDLRTPLTSISGYLDLIINKENLPPDKAKHYAEIAYNKSLQMEHLISELFNYTKLNFGDGNISKERIDLAYLIRQMFEEFMPIFQSNGLSGRLNIKDEPLFIEADGNMIARVFDNIITNAIRYGSDGKYVDIELFRDSDEAIARVINYDSLISEEDLPNIFETFYRADKSRSSKESAGSGLGLAIAKNIIDLHGGSISVQSSLEKTCFEIRLHLAVFRKN